MRRAETDITSLLPDIQEIIKSGCASVETRLLSSMRVVLKRLTLKHTCCVPHRKILPLPARKSATMFMTLSSNTRQCEEIPRGTNAGANVVYRSPAGIMAGEKITSVASAGLYVPRGKGAFPSVMIMLATRKSSWCTAHYRCDTTQA